MNTFLLYCFAFFKSSKEEKYLAPGLTFKYRLGTVSILWLKTSGLASKTFLNASPFLKKSGVKTSIVVSGFFFLVISIVSLK